MNFSSLIRIVLSGALITVASASNGFAGDTSCIERWSDAAPVVRANRLVDVEDLTAKAPKKLGGSIVKATLCESNGSYTYALVLRTEKGKLRSVTVDARDPF